MRFCWACAFAVAYGEYCVVFEECDIYAVYVERVHDDMMMNGLYMRFMQCVDDAAKGADLVRC